MNFPFFLDTVGPESRLKRWVNLWPPTSFTEEFIDTSGGQPRRLQEVETSSVCAFEGNEASIALVFIGNLALVLVALLAIFLIHVTLVSGIQAYWLAKVLLFDLCSLLAVVLMFVVVKMSTCLLINTKSTDVPPSFILYQ